MTIFPEQLGPYQLHPPSPGETRGWGLAWNDEWLPVILEDRDACLRLMDTEPLPNWDELMVDLRDRYNRNQGINVSVAHINAYLADRYIQEYTEF